MVYAWGGSCSTLEEGVGLRLGRELVYAWGGGWSTLGDGVGLRLGRRLVYAWGWSWCFFPIVTIVELLKYEFSGQCYKMECAVMNNISVNRNS